MSEMFVPVDTVLDEESEGIEQFQGVLMFPTAGASIRQGTATVNIAGTYTNEVPIMDIPALASQESLG